MYHVRKLTIDHLTLLLIHLKIAYNEFKFCSRQIQGRTVMKVAAVAFVALGLAVAGSAAASSRVTDVDYLKANRCKGIAAGMGADTAGLDAFIKAEGRTRVDYVLRRGEEEASRAKRQTADANLKDRLSAELSGGCAAYMGEGKSTSGQ
jgi:hypothetical protein